VVELLLLLASWPLAGLLLRTRSTRQHVSTVGLPIAYFAGLALIHWPGAAIYLVEGFSVRDPEIVLQGFTLTTYGLWSFCLGVLISRRIVIQKKHISPGRNMLERDISIQHLENLSFFFLAIGLFTQLIVIPRVGAVPTLSSVLSGFATLSVVGVCLGLWHAMTSGDMRRFIIWILLAFTFPFITLTHSAFLGYGVHKLIVVFAFISSFRRLGFKSLVLLLVVIYLGMSLFVAYMKNREELREIVWQQSAGYSQRIDLIEKMFFDFEMFDPTNYDHLYQIDRRLNQNHLVGEAASYLERGRNEFAKGGTIWFSFVALIPRAIWLDKPIVGGGGNIVSEYTGLYFAQGTSVGAGQVFEFYINFGVFGVILGFVIFGIIIGLFDGRAALAISLGDYRSFIMWFLPGISFLQAGGNLVEITTSVGAAIGSAIIAIKISQGFTRYRAVRHQQVVR